MIHVRRRPPPDGRLELTSTHEHHHRSITLCRMIREVFDASSPSPDASGPAAAATVSLVDHSESESDPGPHLRAFAVAGPRSRADRLVPDPYAVEWADVGLPDVRAACARLEDAGRLRPWKNDCAFWIGNLTTHPTRASLVEMAARSGGRLDARAIDWCGNAIPPALAPGRVTLEDHADFRYLVDVQGVGYSARIKYLMHSGRPLLVADRRHWDWATVDAVPWTHYVPVAEDLGDLLEKIAWLDAHPDEAAAIAAAALTFVRAKMAPEAMRAAMAKLF